MNEGQLPPTTSSSPLPQPSAPRPPVTPVFPTAPSSAPMPPSVPVPPPAPVAPPQPRVAPPPPPWLQRARTPAQPAAAPMAFASSPSAAPAPDALATEDKEWGPLKPIRKVPKPSEAKSAYVLAQTEHVVLPEEEASNRKGIIIASIAAFLLIAGGTLAFVFYGRAAKTNNASTLQVINAAVNNVNTSTVFPADNTNAGSNANAAIVDTDADGLSDASEVQRGTDPKKADTDGDGFTDGQEVSGGYNPLGPGKL